MTQKYKSDIISSARADRLVKIRDLVVLSIERAVFVRKELAELAKSEGVFVRERDGRVYDYSSIYRYLEALRFLRIDKSARYDYLGMIEWAPSAFQLAEQGKDNTKTSLLSSSEKRIFAEVIFNSEVFTLFLTSFTDVADTSKPSRSEFLRQAKPIYVINNLVTRPPQEEKSEDWPSEENVEISFAPIGANVKRKPVQEFLYTYRLWCMDAGLVDELNIKEVVKYKTIPSGAHVIYPIDEAQELDIEQFAEILRNSTRFSGRVAKVVPISSLMYAVCPQYKLGVEQFKFLVTELAERKKDKFHLERGPGVLIQDFAKRNSKKYSDRYANHRYYIIVNGTVRTNLVMYPDR
jgi:hypothetical protein